MNKLKLLIVLITIISFLSFAKDTKAACYSPTTNEYSSWSACRAKNSGVLLCNQSQSDGSEVIICCDSGSQCPGGTTNQRPPEGSNIGCEGRLGTINTAIGCIPYTNSTELITFVLRWGLGIAGGAAFLLILVAGFQIMTSRGDPNRLKAGQELLTSAIAGLILLIFSIFILKVIGLDILGIKEFGTSTSQTSTGGKQ